MNWLIRFLFVVSGFIAAFFVARDSLHFAVVQMTISVLLFTTVVAVVAFWPQIVRKWKARRK